MKEPIENALHRLRDSSSSERAPDSLESKLLLSFRAHHASKKRRRLWVPAALAATLALAFWLRSPAPPALAPPAQAPRPIAQQQEQPVVRKVEVVAPKPGSGRKASARRAPVRRLAAKPPTPPQEFIEIPYAPALTDYDSGRVVRVNMPGASVRSLGLPVMSDRVQADVFLGDDGIARAIRVVSNSGLNSRR
jgi:hypothetical protein